MCVFHVAGPARRSDLSGPRGIGWLSVLLEAGTRQLGPSKMARRPSPRQTASRHRSRDKAAIPSFNRSTIDLIAPVAHRDKGRSITAFAKKVAVITGASQAIGATLVRAFRNRDYGCGDT